MTPLPRIAVISGSFRAGFSYQENLWTEELARRGETVRVFTPVSTEAQVTAADGYTREAVPTRGLPRRNLFHTTALAPAVRAFAPELILWFGPPQRFGVDVARAADLAGVPLIAFMGQNRQMHAFDWRARAVPARERALALAYRLVRGPAVALAARRADIVVCNTPETADIVCDLLPRRQRAAARAKLRPTPLGFDPRVFGHRPRAADGRVVAVVSSRFAPEKAPALRLALAGLEQAMDDDPRLVGLFVGFDDGPLSAQMGELLDRSRHRTRLQRRRFGDRAALADAFGAADLALFVRPSISAQEALGCGLYGVLADGGSMDWLLSGPADGRLFAAGARDALAAALLEASARVAAEPPSARAERAARARRLGYDRIVDGVLGALGDRNPLRHGPSGDHSRKP